MSSYTYQIAQLTDVEPIFKFESTLKFGAEAESIENKIQMWDSSYRIEALEHYFKLGWSFLALNQNKEIVGFFLGQPFLFMDKQTQTLWIEYVSAINEEVKTELIDLAYRLSREKHFQRVLLSSDFEKETLSKSFPFQKWERRTSILKTTK